MGAGRNWSQRLGGSSSWGWVAMGRNGWLDVVRRFHGGAAPVYMLAAWRLDATTPSGELSIDSRASRDDFLRSFFLAF